MSSHRYSPKFKDEVVRQVREREYSAKAVSARLGVSSHSLYASGKAVKPIREEECSLGLIEAKRENLKSRAELTWPPEIEPGLSYYPSFDDV